VIWAENEDVQQVMRRVPIDAGHLVAMESNRRSVSSSEGDFEALISATRDDLLRYAVRRLDNNEAVEDTVAETYVVAWRRWTERPSSDEQIFWLYAIARLVLANVQRGQRRRIRLFDRLAAAHRIASTGDQAINDRLFSAMASLPPEDREAVRLAYWEGLTYRQIGQVLGSSENAVELRLRRARNALRVRLQDRLDQASKQSTAQEIPRIQEKVVEQ
jgi:RNA polymerase sigma-70 factor (ECF subfamily)